MLHRRFDELETAFFMQDFNIHYLTIVMTQADLGTHPKPHPLRTIEPQRTITREVSLSCPSPLQPLGGSSPAAVFAWLEHFNRIQPEMCNFDEIPLLYGEPCGRIWQALGIKQWMILDLYLSSLLTQARCPKSFQSWLGFLGEYIV
ncbi:hypothetical protein PABG_06149 [Paracoccidioides brasiliensis Pb03]|nr:hypothetical protein PABG_06149 [Paracoccidioides brasiliensis Pb03]